MQPVSQLVAICLIINLKMERVFAVGLLVGEDLVKTVSFRSFNGRLMFQFSTDGIVKTLWNKSFPVDSGKQLPLEKKVYYQTYTCDLKVQISYQQFVNCTKSLNSPINYYHLFNSSFQNMERPRGVVGVGSVGAREPMDFQKALIGTQVNPLKNWCSKCCEPTD